MISRRKSALTRFRVGRVSVYLHHGAWWIYHRDGIKQVRRRIGGDRNEAEQVAAQINGQLAAGAPSLLAFTPIGVPDLRQRFLDYHEHVLKSSIATVRRYRAPTQHLENFSAQRIKSPQAHEVRPDAFATYLRAIEVAPNGHANTAKRRLRDKGIQFILETCRAMFSFAAKRRHLPPYSGNPFAELPLDRLKIEDAKAIFVFDAESELEFLRAADTWEFAIHFTLAKTGLRSGELTHLLIEEVDLESGWLQVRNKTELGWRVKTGTERSVPLLPELVGVLRWVIGSRRAGPVFLRPRFQHGERPELNGDRRELERVCKERQSQAGNHSRGEILRIARNMWRDAGALKPDMIRTSFMRIARTIDRPEASCPKSWRHTFATLLQDANVDPLIRQITLGHKPTSGSGLGMTAAYSHSRPETQRQQIEDALRRWPKTLELTRNFAQGGAQ